MEVSSATDQIREFVGEYDEEGVYLYQAFNDAIADYAVEHQRLGGPAFNQRRMTWVKPSFAWVLYRSGYAKKANQTRILKIKLSHKSLGALLAQNATTSNIRIQWDPARDIHGARRDRGICVPRKMLSAGVNERAIQIGLASSLSQEYVASIVKIEDVTELARRVGDIHETMLSRGTENGWKGLMAQVVPHIPEERVYVPHCSKLELLNIGIEVKD